MSFTFAHLSDPHLPLPAQRLPLSQLLNKRLFSALSWQWRRRHLHQPTHLAAVLADLAAQHPDHIVVTGDLVNLALPEEFTAARDWLELLGRPDEVSVVPGNHEAMTAVRPGLELWTPWMTGDDGRPGFPYLRRRGPVAFIGLSTAVVTPPLLASGRVGARQSAQAAEMLKLTGVEGLFRIVLMHHPPTVGGRKGLSDAQGIGAMLADAGAELLLHGHFHRTRIDHLPRREAQPIPVIGIGSASALDQDGSSWLLGRLSRRPQGGWDLDVSVRGARSNGFQPTARFRLTYPRPCLERAATPCWNDAGPEAT